MGVSPDIRVVVAGLAAGLILGSPGSGAAQSDPAGANRLSVAHGSDLTRGHVGPRAAGILASADRPRPGIAIRDETAAPYLQRIDGAATYDGIVVPGPHLLIENTAFDGPLDVYAKRPLVLRGVSVRISGAAYWGVLSRAGAGPLHVLWSEIGGAAVVPGQAGVQRGLYLESDNAVVYRSHISNTADGIQVHAPGARVIETLIDDLVTWPGEHNDGIQVIGRGERLTVQRSRIVNRHRQTSAILLQRGGHVIEDNDLAGGGWVIYGGATSKTSNIVATRGVRITGNVFGQAFSVMSGTFGPVADWNGSTASGNVWRDNRFADGTAVEPDRKPRP